MAAITEVTSSGMDVPTATIVRPMIVSDTPSPLARAIEPSTRKRAPKIVIAMPATAIATDKAMVAGPFRASSARCSATTAASSGDCLSCT